jgi:hypothetical protein
MVECLGRRGVEEVVVAVLMVVEGGNVLMKHMRMDSVLLLLPLHHHPLRHKMQLDHLSLHSITLVLGFRGGKDILDKVRSTSWTDFVVVEFIATCMTVFQLSGHIAVDFGCDAE